MDQEQKNIVWTQQVKSELEIEEYSNFHLEKETVKTNELCATITPFHIKIVGLIDLTGAFPHKSSGVNLYVIVIYDYDIN